MSFPFFNAQTTDGFLTLVLLLIMLAFICFCVIASFDSILFVVFLNMRMISEIMIREIDEIQQMLVAKSKGIKSEIRNRLLNFVWMHRKYNE